MKGKVLTAKSLYEVRKIHKLSEEYNIKVNKEHSKRLLELMHKHIDEIDCLMSENDAHAFIETGDLIILCFELLLEHDVSIDGTVQKCFKRYNKKLGKLLEDMGSKEEIK